MDIKSFLMTIIHNMLLFNFPERPISARSFSAAGSSADVFLEVIDLKIRFTLV